MTFPAIIADDGFEVALTHSAAGSAGKAKQLVTLNGGTKQRDHTMGGMGGSARVNDLRLLSMIGNTKSLIFKGDPVSAEDIVTNANEPRLDLDVLRAFGPDIAQPGAAAFIREVAVLAISSSPATVQAKQVVAEIANLKKLVNLDPTPQTREAVKQAIARSVERIAQIISPPAPAIPGTPAIIPIIPQAIVSFAQDMVKQIIVTHNMPQLAPMMAQIAAYTTPTIAAPAATAPEGTSPIITAAVAQIVQEAVQDKTVDLSSPQTQAVILDTLAEKIPAAKISEIRAALTQALVVRGVTPTIIIAPTPTAAPAATSPASPTASVQTVIPQTPAPPQVVTPIVIAAAVTEVVRPAIIQPVTGAPQTPVQQVPAQQTPVQQTRLPQTPAQYAPVATAPSRPANINTPPPAPKTPDAPAVRNENAQPLIKNSAPPAAKPASAAPPAPAKPEKNVAPSPAAAPKNPPASGPAERPVIAPKNPAQPVSAHPKPAQPAPRQPEKNQEPPKPATSATPCGKPVCDCGKDFNEKAAPPPTVVTYDHTGKPIVIDVEKEKEKVKETLRTNGADQTGLSQDDLKKIVEKKPESKSSPTKQEFDLCSCGKKGPHSHGTSEVKSQKISEDAVLSNTALTAKPARSWGKKAPG